MKTVSKKFLQKMANKLKFQFMILDGKLNFIPSGDTIAWEFPILCPELSPGEVIKPQEKCEYPEWDRKTKEVSLFWSDGTVQNGKWLGPVMIKTDHEVERLSQWDHLRKTGGRGDAGQTTSC